MEQALQRKHLVVQLEDRTIVIPYSSIERIEVTPPANQTPDFSILDARITAVRAEVEPALVKAR
jgi:hypothetical protein